MSKKPTNLQLVSSDANELGLEVLHGRNPQGIEQLRACRCGEVVATRLVERHQGRAIGGCIDYDRDLTHDQRTVVRLALDEGVRTLRDGQGREAVS